jgi:hypothetical protein
MESTQLSTPYCPFVTHIGIQEAALDCNLPYFVHVAIIGVE